MNRFFPWIGGFIGVAIIATGGYFGYSSYSSNRSDQNTNNTEQRETDPKEQEVILCSGSENVLFEDQVLVYVIRENLGLLGSEDDFSLSLSCDELLRLEKLKGSDRGIENLKGLEHAVSLKDLDLSKNILLNPNPAFLLPNLRALNLTKTTLPYFSSASEDSLRALDLGGNYLPSISGIEKYKKINSLNIQKNSIRDIRPLLEMPGLSSVSMYNNPLDLSPNKEARQIIQQLLDRGGLEVFWDELSLDLRVGDGARNKEIEVNAPDIVSLTALIQKNKTFETEISIESVEFFEVLPQGALSSIHLDTTVPFSFDVPFDLSDEGVFQYAAEVRTKFGATFLTPASDYVKIRVKKSECLKNADCNDNNACTNNVCVNNKCQYTPIDRCSECRVDGDCKDDRQCTTDRCVSGKCEHYLQTACSEYEEISCNDGKDNNKNGKIDCADSDCAGSASCKETICYDGVDNDKDGKIDCKDSDCSVESTCGEICDNGVNDDGDSNVDCNDHRDCADHPSCQAPVQACNSDVSIVCKEIYAENESQVHCSLKMNIKGNNRCSASLVTCNRDRCWSDTSGGNFDFQGCRNLQRELQRLPAGTVLTGNSALELDSTQMCGGLNLCRKIILCE